MVRYARNGQPEAADAATSTALRLMGDVHSTRVSDRLRELGVELDPKALGTAVLDSRDRIRTALQAT
ncbi:hypothetical protein ACFTXJ_37455 [Streptomyces zhihengii]|uniref:hypothetical protein n=1 Tax=Streptomyces zhihengii TaxID=1818004 RepID=UPI0036396C4F